MDLKNKQGIKDIPELILTLSLLKDVLERLMSLYGNDETLTIIENGIWHYRCFLFKS